MQRAYHIAGLVALATSLGACARGQGTVEGLVYERQREIAIEGAFVQIESLEGDSSEQITFTDINGLYRFEGVPEGLNRVTVIKEGYATNPAPNACSGCRKFADVVEDETLTLDFPLDFFARSISQSVLVRILDERGPLSGATVDLYRGPCVGRGGSNCFRRFPDDPNYFFDGSFTTDANGTASVPFASDSNQIFEFSDYYYQLRVTAPEHQNRIFELVFNINNLPASRDLFLPGL